MGACWMGVLAVLGCAEFGGLRAAEPIVLREALVLESVGRAGRNTLFTDALEAALVVGRPVSPAVGDEVVSARGGSPRVWARAVAGDDGWFSGRAFRGGWAHFSHAVAEESVVLFQAAGHSMAYVQGEPRVGDIYGYGYVSVPVALRAGTNEFLVATGRGRLRVQLSMPPAPVFLQATDPTLPDRVVGEATDTWGAVVLVNATRQWVRGAMVRATLGDGPAVATGVGDVPPLGVRKVGFRIVGDAPEAAEGESPSSSLRVSLSLPDGTIGVGEPLGMDLRIRRPEQTHKRTFVSAIDGSVQYFAVNPGSAVPVPEGAEPALFLSLHGASVEAMGQAEAYGPKRWGTLVAPTNRRPYGFDWEEWGRLDAMEVLELAKARWRPDPSRIYLTGHSMGGHGTWNFGVTFPDRFAAIAPSAGWISFFSYAGTDSFSNATPVEAVLRRSAASSDTLAMATNHLQHGVYILHGDADNNVPVREARRMREVLGTFHRDFDWHEQPGAGHWWGNSDEPGSECVDWPPVFDFFARHRIPRGTELRRIQFVTVNPGVNARSHWVGIDRQVRALEPSEVDALWDPGLQRVTATTRNVERLVLDVTEWGPAPSGFRVDLDGKGFEKVMPTGGSAPGTGTAGPVDRRVLAFEKAGDGWEVAAGLADSRGKGPHRAGPFKDAFRHRMVFVYGTKGTSEESEWALAKARFDAESFWYRGNGSVDVIPDTAFSPDRYPDRGVILYGHAEMNAAWPALLSGSPVEARRGVIRVGGRSVERDDLACLFLQPRSDSEIASVGVVAGSGMAGLRMTNRLPYFMAGTGYPDCLVVGADALERGTEGIVAAGFFGNDWSVERGDFAWGKPPAVSSGR